MSEEKRKELEKTEKQNEQIEDMGQLEDVYKRQLYRRNEKTSGYCRKLSHILCQECRTC